MYKFDIDDNSTKVFELGTLDKEIIDLLNLNTIEGKILLSSDRIKHIKKHEKDYSSYEEFKKCTESAIEILQYPDFVGIHPDGDSIQYVKEISKNVLVAVRINNTGKNWVKSIYPISDSKLEGYLNSGRLKKVDNLDNTN